MKYTLLMLCVALSLPFAGISKTISTVTSTDSIPMLDRKAPDFSLKNMEGNTVTLSSYKGKIVVLDFWATWCKPCMESFSGMQKAVEKYAAQKEVVFLFIDTREKVANYKELAKELIKNKKYPFKVLYDEQGSDGGQNKVYKEYGMVGIPTKFIIDDKGIIRYKLEGFMPGRTDEQQVAEIAELIENVKAMSNKASKQ